MAYMCGVERGERNISLENIAKIAEALGVEPKKFFEFDKPSLQPSSNVKETTLEEIVAILPR